MFPFAVPLPRITRRRRNHLKAVPEIPTVPEIEAAAELHEQGRQDYNRGSRLKRQARKVIDRAPDGQHGRVTITREVVPAREVIDMEAVEAFFARHGRKVPTKKCAPTINLTWTTGN